MSVNRQQLRMWDAQSNGVPDWHAAFADALAEHEGRQLLGAGAVPATEVIVGIVEEEEMEVGMYVPYAGAELPANGKYLWCDGSAFDPAEYPELAAVVGTRWNLPGDPPEVRRVPNVSRRAVVGPGGDWAPGAVVGSESHALTVSQMPAHNHGGATGSAGSHHHGGATGAAGNHSHGVGLARGPRQTSTGADNTVVGGGSEIAPQTTSAPNHTHAIPSEGGHTHTIAAAGGGEPHPNVQPSLVSYWIIRAKP